METKEQTQWKQERPKWCPHKDCIFIRSSQGSMCGGELPKPTEHNGGINTHHFCLSEGGNSCYEVNTNDLEWFRWIFDSLDGRETSWLSKPLCEKCGNSMTKVTEYSCECGLCTHDWERKEFFCYDIRPEVKYKCRKCGKETWELEQ